MNHFIISLDEPTHYNSKSKFVNRSLKRKYIFHFGLFGLTFLDKPGLKYIYIFLIFSFQKFVQHGPQSIHPQTGQQAEQFFTPKLFYAKIYLGKKNAFLRQKTHFYAKTVFRQKLYSSTMGHGQSLTVLGSFNNSCVCAIIDRHPPNSILFIILKSVPGMGKCNIG